MFYLGKIIPAFLAQIATLLHQLFFSPLQMPAGYLKQLLIYLCGLNLFTICTSFFFFFAIWQVFVQIDLCSLFSDVKFANKLLCKALFLGQ